MCAAEVRLDGFVLAERGSSWTVIAWLPEMESATSPTASDHAPPVNQGIGDELADE
jgi:hypothetical protein